MKPRPVLDIVHLDRERGAGLRCGLGDKTMEIVLSHREIHHREELKRKKEMFLELKKQTFLTVFVRERNQMILQKLKSNF